MNKTELILNVVKQTGLPKKEATAAVNSVIASITTEVADGEPVMILGFGTFEARNYAARSGVSPATGATMNIPAKRLPRFRPHSKFKDMVNR